MSGDSFKQGDFGRRQFIAASAEALPFPDATFDAVVSRFGVMLFADPARGVREMVRVARPGGTVAAAVWGSAERNPYLAVRVLESRPVTG